MGLLVPALDAGCLPGELAHVGDLVAADLAVLDDLDLGDGGGVKREGALDADPRGDLADGEGLGDPTTTPGERGKRFAGKSKYPLRKMLSFAWEGVSSLTVSPLRKSGTSLRS